MKIQKLVAPVGVAASRSAWRCDSGPRRRRPTTSSRSVQQETLNDYGTGAPMIGYTVRGLSPSSDAVPHNGRVVCSNRDGRRAGGWATPLVPLFNARAQSGQNYRASSVMAPPGAARWLDDRQALLRCRGRHPQQRRVQRRCPGSARLGARPPEGGLIPLAAAPRTSQASPPRTSAVHLPSGGGEVASAPAEAPGAAEVIAPPPFQLTEPEVAEPGFNAVRRRASLIVPSPS